jgi:hypothetical protein
LILINCCTGYSQQTENTGWLFLSHAQKLNSKFDLLADVQMRSADQLTYLNTLLLRTALQYHLNKIHSFAIGYASKSDWLKEDDQTKYDHENRIYQQYQVNVDLSKIEMNARLRFEQRFTKEESRHSRFSQRGRILLAAKIPFKKNNAFTSGPYANIQNELFLNVQHKENVNNNLFDQNRSQISFGYRWSKKIDTDLGYQFWYQKEESGATKTNVLQIMVSTNF